MHPFRQKSRIDAKGRLTEEAMMALSESSANVILTAANAPVVTYIYSAGCCIVYEIEGLLTLCRCLLRLRF